MIVGTETNRENLTLTEADLVACRPIVGEGGHVLRALCPFHGSDRQRSLRVQVHSGRFVCFACGAWGYMDTARAQWREAQQRQAAFRRPSAHRQRLTHRRQSPPPLSRPPAAAARPHSADPPAPRAPVPVRSDLAHQLAAFQTALPGSRGETYLQPRREERSSRCLRTSVSPGRSASRSWSSTAASRTRKPSAWRGSRSRPQAQCREGRAAAMGPTLRV
jgi:CHC2 zinc finger